MEAVLQATDDTWRLSEERSADRHLLESLHARFGPRGRERHPAYVEPKFGSAQVSSDGVG